MTHTAQRVLLALLVLAMGWMSVASAAERRLSLDQAIGLALGKNETLTIEREALGVATAAVDQAGGAYDQFLELEGSWQKSKDPASTLAGTTAPWIVPDSRSSGLNVAIRQLLPSGGALALRASGARQTTEGGVSLFSPSYGTQVGVELRQPLLRDLAIDAARFSVHTAEADRRGAEASLQRIANETLAGVERAYWTLAAGRLAVDVRREAVTLADEQLQQTQHRVSNGAAPRTELAQPRAELERRRGELLAGLEAASRAENALKVLILGETDAAWADSITPGEPMEIDRAPVDVQAALTTAQSARPELALAAAALDRRNVETRFANNGVRPSLDAVVSYDRFGLAGNRLGAPAAFDGGLDQSFQSLRDNEFNAARVALVLGLPLRNSTARSAAVAARHVQRQAEAEMALVRKSIRAEVLNAAAALETASQRIEAARSARQAAEIQLAAEKDRYDTGLSTNFLVLTRQNDLSRARLDEIAALTDYRTARTEMARADGSLIEHTSKYVHIQGN